ncbi:TlpA disulfide reductase family protein [Paenibacillus sp. LHD-38]|uniref:TlpA family protein disulfide reductase n=1 Tax=Paenibacillus sp. LHD-38 TaxID=3072143 RepID=UPI00280F4886|nr:TlpA disulfide reductase family protein [Paenibacillus sp. LHD-38]MDQ8737095.1 TlpA disulfide reductase family protein [Paenibacillus sp. LHD-38]
MKNSILIIGVFLLATAFGLLLILKSDKTSGTEGGKLNASALENILSVDQEAALHRTATSGVKAPAFTLKAVNGKTYTVAETNDKPIVLQFWASWCEACSVEAPTLKKLHETFRDKVDFYGVNLSSEEKQADQINAFIQKNEWGFTNLLDANKRASYLYELHALPTTFIIDKDGTVLDTFHLIDPMEFESKLEMLTEGR